MDIKQYWNAITEQRREDIRQFFHQEAKIYWHNSNEKFTVEEFLTANCEYPGTWANEVERVVETKDMIICAVRIYTKDKTLSFHVSSFISLKENKVIRVDEYWGDDTQPPQWRVDMNVGSKIK